MADPVYVVEQHILELQEDNKRLRAEVAALTDKVIVLEGALGHSQSEAQGWASANGKMMRDLEDFAVMIRRLVRRLRAVTPPNDDSVGAAAMQMLERRGMHAEPLRNAALGGEGR